MPEVVGLDVEDEDTGLTIEQTTPERVEVKLDLSDAVEAILESLPERDAYIIDSGAGIERIKSMRARIAEDLGMTEREIKTELQRIKRGLRRDPRVLDLKEAAGYVTVAERKAESARRLAHLPQWPPSAPLPEPVQPVRVPRPGMRCYTLTEAERLAVVARCEEKSGNRKKGGLQGVSYGKGARYSK